MANSVYIHIPFCKSICSYCDFCKQFYNSELVNKYLNALEKEIKEKYDNSIIKTIYIGGGSPSALNKEELTKLFNIIKIFKLDKDIEFTFEMNVNDIDEDKLKLLKDNNVNRLSIGIETINEKFYKFLNRYNDKKIIDNNIKLVQKYFDNYNLDLMYAFPNEKVQDVLNDLSYIVKLEPKHISIYSLIIEEHTKIFIDKIEPISEDIESNMYYEIIKYLKDNNYNHYEISNFAKDGYESVHNLVYWNNNEYFGFGLGSSGYLNKIRYTNTRSLNNYIGGKYILDSEKISKSIDMENEMMLGLRKIKGINKKEFSNKFGFKIEDVFDIINLINDKLLIDDGEYIYISEDKLYVSNSILVNFIGGSKID